VQSLPPQHVQNSKQGTPQEGQPGSAGPATMGYSRATHLHLLLSEWHTVQTRLCQPISHTQLFCLPACLPPSAARFLLLGSNQTGGMSMFFRESPTKIPRACSGCISDQLPFHLSPPAHETLRNDSPADTVVFPLLLNTYSCLSMEWYKNYCKYIHTSRHPHTSARDVFTRKAEG